MVCLGKLNGLYMAYICCNIRDWEWLVYLSRWSVYASGRLDKFHCTYFRGILGLHSWKMYSNVTDWTFYSLTLRGDKKDSAVLCTNDKTFDIKEAETSNTLLLTENCVLGPDLPDGDTPSLLCRQVSCDTSDSKELLKCFHHETFRPYSNHEWTVTPVERV